MGKHRSGTNRDEFFYISYHPITDDPIIDFQCKTLSVPVAGALFLGLSRNASYEAARRGDIPTIKVGKSLEVPIDKMMLKLVDDGGLKEDGKFMRDDDGTMRRVQ